MRVKKGEKNAYQYKSLDKADLYDQINRVVELLEKYLETRSDIQLEDIACDYTGLSEIIIRIDKRNDYFAIFHDTEEINEVKRAALLSYWLLKFRPFTYKQSVGAGEKEKANINNVFAVFILLSAVNETVRRASRQFRPSPEYLRKLTYAFRYWDLSKEAMMMIGESLCEGMSN